MPAAAELVEPAHLWVPPHTSSAVEDAIDLAETCGLVLEPEQRLAVEAILAESPSGKWAAFEAAIVAPRQNIKTFIFKVIVIADLWLFGGELVVWTAHEFSTAMEAFRDVTTLIESTPHLSRYVKKVNAANGEEGVELTTGQRLRFKARTKTGGRGLTGTRVILDEAFALQPSHMGSLMPTMSAQSLHGNPQILYGSSAGHSSSVVLRSIRDRGRAGGDPSLVYVEWCAPDGECATEGCEHQYGVQGCVLDDRERWAKANLALGRRISIDFLAAERRSLPPEEFAREILGWWDEPADADQVIPLDAWYQCTDQGHQPSGKLAYALDVAPNGRTTAIAASDGQHVEIVKYGAGTAWVVDLCVERRDSFDEIVLDPAGPAGLLVVPLEAAGITVRQVTAREHAQACGALVADVDDDRLRHIGQLELDNAVENAGRRELGDGGWLWSRKKSSVDISPLVAATLAHWAARLLERESVYNDREMNVL